MGGRGACQHLSAGCGARGRPGPPPPVPAPPLWTDRRRSWRLWTWRCGRRVRGGRQSTGTRVKPHGLPTRLTSARAQHCQQHARGALSPRAAHLSRGAASTAMCLHTASGLASGGPSTRTPRNTRRGSLQPRRPADVRHTRRRAGLQRAALHVSRPCCEPLAESMAHSCVFAFDAPCRSQRQSVWQSVPQCQAPVFPGVSSC